MAASATAATCTLLSRVATLQTPHFSLVLSKGSVVDFSYPKNESKSAIVNAANEGCVGGGGVDGAISSAGGPNLLSDRRALKENAPGRRCDTGSAKITGPNTYAQLKVPFVIHAVGPNFNYVSEGQGDALLSSAYTESLNLAREHKIEAVAFSLLSSGVFRGNKSVSSVLENGVDAIRDFEGYDELEEVHLCAFNDKETSVLSSILKGLGGTVHSEQDSSCNLL